jgi:hypothetical protein
MPEAFSPLEKRPRDHVGFAAVDFHLAEVLLGVRRVIPQGVGGTRAFQTGGKLGTELEIVIQD